MQILGFRLPEVLITQDFQEEISFKNKTQRFQPTLIPQAKLGMTIFSGEISGTFWASLIAQLVKNQPAMWETPVWFLGWEDPLEKGWATHSSILGLPLWLSW